MSDIIVCYIDYRKPGTEEWNTVKMASGMLSRGTRAEQSRLLKLFKDYRSNWEYRLREEFEDEN